MALQVWLPLNENGNLKNQGLADVTVTNNGATYNSNGKIGGCYTGFNTGFMTLNKEAMSTLSGEFTISCWVKINSYNSNYQTVWSGCSTSSSWNNMIMVLLRNGSGSNLIFCISNNSSATESRCSAGSIELGNWMHITCCYKPGHIITYKNGILVLDYSTSITPNVSTIKSCLIGRDYGSYPNDMNINDFRIYDHCLSPEEVKEISKGLICHYTCDDISLYNGKLYDSSGYCNDGTVYGTLTTSTDTARNNKCINFSAGYAKNTPLHTGVEVMSMSAWVYLNGYSSNGNFHIFIGGIYMCITPAGKLSTYCYGKDPAGYHTGTGVIPLNTWTHLAIVWDPSYVYGYINAVQDFKIACTGSTSWQGDSAIGRYWGNSSYTNGYISDFRLYVSALSADDIKALYQEAAFIDHKGNIGCYLFYEDADSQITKTGQVKTEEFEEISDLSDGVAKVYEQKIECNQLIEI